MCRRLVDGWCMLWKRWFWSSIYASIYGTWWFDMMVALCLWKHLHSAKCYCWFRIRYGSLMRGDLPFNMASGHPVDKPMICQDVTNNWPRPPAHESKYSAKKYECDERVTDIVVTDIVVHIPKVLNPRSLIPHNFIQSNIGNLVST